MEQSPSAYIALSPRGKYGVIAGAGCLWFYHLFFSFALPVAFPALLSHYNLMAWYAIFGGISSLGSCLVTPSVESWETASGGAESASLWAGSVWR